MNKEEKATAYHEAGHALADYRFGQDGGRITIVPKGGKAGSTLSEAPWGNGSTDIGHIISFFAGFASESKYNEDASKLGSSDDDEKAADLLKRTNIEGG